jgi:hypothetical protein
MEKWKALINHGIELLDDNHGREVREFYKNLNVSNVDRFGFCNTKKDRDLTRFYLIQENGLINNVSDDFCHNNNFKIVTLEEAKKIVDGGGSIVSTVAPSINISTTKIIGRIIC